MFTGIVEGLGEVITGSPTSLVVTDPGLWPSDPWQLGESISVNGACLTLVSYDEGLKFDLSEETWSRTAFTGLQPGSLVNLERAMKPDTRFGGHIVQGHVDTVGTFLASEPKGTGWTMSFEVPDPKYLIDKGSIAVDGVSLTVVKPVGGCFEVAVIPHTFHHTNLGNLVPGEFVNIEYDIIARYVERLLNLQ